jgi:hypothetical protein
MFNDCLPTSFPLIVSHLLPELTKSDITSCDRTTNRTLRQQWDVLSQCKARILEFVWSPTVSTGVKVSAIKFMQRIIIVQTRGISDPRVLFHQSLLHTHTHCDTRSIIYSFKTKMTPTSQTSLLITPSFRGLP